MRFGISVIFSLMLSQVLLAASYRTTYSLYEGWHAVCYPEDKARYGDSIVMDTIAIPHNFDDYYGARQLLHGNLHGTAVYDIAFDLSQSLMYEEYAFRLRLDGVGSYVTVILNGDTLCSHRPAGRVVTTLDIPDGGLWLRGNKLRVICEHPSHITDMPWVCGGCSSEWGFSEGSQPLGLYRPVYLEVLHKLHIAPFGVHVWSNEHCDTLFVDTEVENLNKLQSRRLRLTTSLELSRGKLASIAKQTVKFKLPYGQKTIIHQAIPLDKKITHWSPTNPFLYTVKSQLSCEDFYSTRDVESDCVMTDFGFRSLEWGRQLKIDEEPCLVKGICEYEHAFGYSHALTNKEIDHRCLLACRMGFNAFREGHQPHNLRYVRDFNQLGVLDWTQFSAHIWYDTPAFRENFKTLLRQWVKERRNDPSIVLWGLQNESTLPREFAEECTAIIKEMDPTCATSYDPNLPHKGRLVTTCNGGSGTDWNVVQNWSGTYGGRLENYAHELCQDNQLLNGEYGAWRTVGLHDTLTVFDSKAPNSEEKFTMLLSSKMRQAESVKDSICGQFLWLMYSHDNPGRWQPDESVRLIDKVGPYNHKGLVTIWGQTTDFARQLLNDTIRLVEENNLADEIFRPIPDMNYLYRYNCGGDTVVDSWGQTWIGDDTRFSTSWAQRPLFAADSLCPVLASQGVTTSPVNVLYTEHPSYRLSDANQPLARTFRWGRQDLKFRFPVAPHASYHVDFFTLEPWNNTSDGRAFDIKVNDMEVAHSFSPRKLTNGRNRLIRTSFNVNSGDSSCLLLSFPYVEIGQAVVCAIAISVIPALYNEIQMPEVDSVPGYPYSEGLTWAALDTLHLAVTPKGYFPNYDGDQNTQVKADPQTQTDGVIRYDFEVGLAHEYILRFRYRNTSSITVPSRWEIRSRVDGRSIAQGDLALPVTPAKWKSVSTTTGGMINAGAYTLVLSTADSQQKEDVSFDYLTIE